MLILLYRHISLFSMEEHKTKPQLQKKRKQLNTHMGRCESDIKQLFMEKGCLPSAGASQELNATNTTRSIVPVDSNQTNMNLIKKYSVLSFCSHCCFMSVMC